MPTKPTHSSSILVLAYPIYSIVRRNINEESL